jgi:hypothetical protein
MCGKQHSNEYCTGQEVSYKEHSIDVHCFDAMPINMIYIFQAVFCPIPLLDGSEHPHNRPT